MAKLTKAYETQLLKIAHQLCYNQKLDGTQLILSDKNKAKFKEAETLVRKAYLILSDLS